MTYNYVKDIDNDSDGKNQYQLVTDSQEIKSIGSYLGKRQLANKYGCLFVKVGDGDYDSIYGCIRSVPYLEERLIKII